MWPAVRWRDWPETSAGQGDRPVARQLPCAREPPPLSGGEFPGRVEQGFQCVGKQGDSKGPTPSFSLSVRHRSSLLYLHRVFPFRTRGEFITGMGAIGQIFWDVLFPFCGDEGVSGGAANPLDCLVDVRLPQSNCPVVTVAGQGVSVGVCFARSLVSRPVMEVLSGGISVVEIAECHGVFAKTCTLGRVVFVKTAPGAGRPITPLASPSRTAGHRDQGSVRGAGRTHLRWDPAAWCTNFSRFPTAR